MGSNQKIGVTTATIIGMNAMIGSGIFTIPATLANQVGPAGILTMIFVTFAVWFMAISLARVAALFSTEGSFYTYVKPWGGHKIALLAASLYLIGLIVAMGLLSQIAGYTLQTFFPNSSPHLLGQICLILLIILNLFGVTLSEIGQQILICTTIFPLIASIGLCLTKINPANLTPFAPHGWLSILKASKTVIFSFFGFECAASLFAIVQDPQKNVPRALAYSISLVGVLYILFTSAVIMTLPLEIFVNPTVPITSALAAVFPNLHWPIVAIHIAILSAIIGTIHSMIWTSSNLLISLVEKCDVLTHKYLVGRKLSAKSAVLIIGGAIYASFATINNVDLFFSMTAACIVSAYIGSMITLLTLPQEWRSGQNIKTIIGLSTATVILYFAVESLIVALT